MHILMSNQSHNEVIKDIQLGVLINTFLSSISSLFL